MREMTKTLIACPFYPDLLCPFDDCQCPDCAYHPESSQTKRVCPVCGKIIARPDTARSSFRGMLAMHIKARHADLWQGDLGTTLDYLAKEEP